MKTVTKKLVKKARAMAKVESLQASAVDELYQLAKSCSQLAMDWEMFGAALSGQIKISSHNASIVIYLSGSAYSDMIVINDSMQSFRFDAKEVVGNECKDAILSMMKNAIKIIWNENSKETPE